MIPILAQPEVQGSARMAGRSPGPPRQLFAPPCCWRWEVAAAPLFFRWRARSDELFGTECPAGGIAGGLPDPVDGALHGAWRLSGGMMLGESHYRHQLEVDIKPFRDVLMGLFITIGMTGLGAGGGPWWQVPACVTGSSCTVLLILLAVTVSREDVDNNLPGAGSLFSMRAL